MSAHHIMAREAVNSMLFDWKQESHKDSIISGKVFLTRARASFPSPDAALYDPNKEFSIAIEFKPPTETKRGILTGLGQAISYLDTYSLSYLIAPDRIESFSMKHYLKELFITRLKSKVSVGLAIYPYDNPSVVSIEIDVIENKIEKKSPGQKISGNYWAAWRDMPPDGVWRLLDIAYSSKKNGIKSALVWKDFFDGYYFPEKKRKSLKNNKSKIIMWDGKTLLQPFSGIKSKLNKKVEDGKISKKEALAKLAEECDSNYHKDNKYKSYKKNVFNYINHLGLWDDQCNLTETGYVLHKVGKLYGSSTKLFRDHLAKATLVDGKHLELIHDIENNTRNKSLRMSDNARIKLYKNFEDRGFIKKNPKIKTSGKRKFLASEFQLWGHFGITRKTHGSYFIPNKGFNFNWEEITRIMML